jgi:hypothetical protein
MPSSTLLWVCVKLERHGGVWYFSTPKGPPSWRSTRRPYRLIDLYEGHRARVLTGC